MRKGFTFLIAALLLLVSHHSWAQVTDELTNTLIGVSGTQYVEWSGITSNSDAVYAGQSAGGNSAIQLRSNNNNSGIVTTTSGGTVTNITITWNSNTVSGRTLDIYGSNTAYTAATDLYGSNQGVLIGSIVMGTSTELDIDDSYEYIGMRSHSGAMYIDKIEITWTAGDPSITHTSVTIDDSNLTNTDLYQGGNAGSLRATVSANGTPISGATVTWSSSNEDIATINAQGNVTLFGIGTTTITASYAGQEGVYSASHAMYQLTVTNSDPNIPGTEANPYTVDQARAAIDANSGITGVYATGIVSGIVTAFNPQYGNISYNISADGSTESDQLQAYRGKSFDGNNFTSADDIQVGDIVVIYGNLKKYNDIYEFDANNILVSLERLNPNITADDVELAYNATSGTINFTVNNPAQDGQLSVDKEGDWISNPAINGSTVTFTTTVNENAGDRQGHIFITYSYNSGQEQCVKDVTVTQTGNPNTTMTIAQVRAQGTGNVATQGTVTSISGKTAYIQDNTAAICVFGNSNLTDLAVGDMITVSGSLTTYNGLLEISSPTYSVISQGNTVQPTVMTIEDINTDYASDNLWQGWLVRIEDATVTAISGQNTTIEQNGNSIVVRGISSDVTYAVGDLLSLTGNIGCFNAAQIANPTDVTTQQGSDPVINANNTLTLAYDATSGEIDYTVSNAVAGTNLNATTDASWISNLNVTADKVTFTTTVNNGDEDRTANITLSYNGASDVMVTVTQQHYVIDYATLPFDFDGGRADIANTDGLTHEGLDSDYGTSPKLKFNTTDDWLLLKFNERPGKLSFDIKGNSYSGSTFTVQTSEDGETFTDLATYTELGATQSEEFNNLGENVRYIRWIYTEKVGGNVALGNIHLQPYAAPAEYYLTIGNPDHVTITATFGTGNSISNDDHESILSGTLITVAVTVEEGYTLETLTVTNDEGDTFTLTESGETWTFEMPNCDVTIDATATATVVQLMTIAQVRAQGTGDVATQGTVTSISGKTAYIQDNTAAICVFGNSNLTDLAVGDMITVSGSLTTYRGLLEIASPTYSVVSQGNTVQPTVMTIEDINTDNAGDNLWQGWLVRIEDATVTAISGQNTTIEQNGHSIVVRGISSDITYAIGDLLSLTGNIGCFDVAQIANPTDVTTQQGSDPVINANNTLTLAYDATSGEIAYTVSNAVAGTNLNATTDASWISNLTVTADKVTFTTTVNNGDEDRTANITLSYNGASDVTVTVTQQHYVADFATLPFAFDGGRADIANTDGLTHEGLDSDYGTSPKLKFNTTDDWLLLKFNERPGKLSFDIKGNSYSGSTFTVQTSEDGENFTDLATYTELGATQSEEFNNLGENVRYIKWIYTEKVGGNVALGNIVLEQYSVPQLYTLTLGNPNHITITANYGSGSITNGNTATLLSGTEVTLTLNIEEGYVLDELTATDENDEAINLTQNGNAWTFHMPSSNISVNATASVAPVIVTTTYNMVTSIESGRHYIISNGSNKAMGAQGGNNRAAVDITVTDGVASVNSESGVCELVINGPFADGFYTIYDATVPGYLFAASDTKNYLRTQEFNDDNGRWSIVFDENGVATVKAQGSNSRNWMRYNTSGLFSCYGETSTQQDIFLYVKDQDESYEFYTDIMGYGEEEGNWSLIASPVNSTIDPSTINMVDSVFDFYAFDKTKDLEWRNYEAGAFNIAPNQGYLYANKYNKTLRFEGQVNTNGNVSLTYNASSNLAGWNLIGNPFGQAASLSNGRPVYVMNTEGTDIIPAESNSINPMQGIFVVAENANDNQVTFSTSTRASSESLVINLYQDKALADRAIIRFDHVSRLPKYMLGKNNAKIYFTQEKQDYAVVNADGQGEMTLNIKVTNKANYTINVKSENMEFEYLRLIDTLTNVEIDLLKTTSYTFSAGRDDLCDRFKITFLEKK